MSNTWTSRAGTSIKVDVSLTEIRNKTGLIATTAEWYADCSACKRLGSYTGDAKDTQPRQNAANLAFGHISTCPGA